ncbi:BQ2448_103 [Microbotryum intermedium]|uniref:BQ2448_103 protein n=1 Tax=Microbotryum intermedium TaxID=269621 RepID=A0A238F1I6_9BASI|nr:BQ2448_103 [Microbotryum intermedium]
MTSTSLPTSRNIPRNFLSNAQPFFCTAERDRLGSEGCAFRNGNKASILSPQLCSNWMRVGPQVRRLSILGFPEGDIPIVEMATIFLAFPSLRSLALEIVLAQERNETEHKRLMPHLVTSMTNMTQLVHLAIVKSTCFDPHFCRATWTAPLRSLSLRGCEELPFTSLPAQPGRRLIRDNLLMPWKLPHLRTLRVKTAVFLDVFVECHRMEAFALYPSKVITSIDLKNFHRPQELHVQPSHVVEVACNAGTGGLLPKVVLRSLRDYGATRGIKFACADGLGKELDFEIKSENEDGDQHHELDYDDDEEEDDDYDIDDTDADRHHRGVGVANVVRLG